TNDKALAHQILEPKYKQPKTYWAQVEGQITEEAIAKLEKGVAIKVDGKEHLTAPAHAFEIKPDPVLPERNPPIRVRKSIPTSWLSLTIIEGKNRQVRKMTAAVGCPTLRLVRYSIGSLTLDGLDPGTHLKLERHQIALLVR